jgi:gamma-glutamyl:cysteine ligase YbdK (ATP-grasp superfamily)
MDDALHLFEAIGIELEYMIVADADLAIMPISDRVLHAVAGSYESEVSFGDVSWSNELALHVLELKTTAPAARLEGWPARFQENVAHINRLLHDHAARLMPTGMHPFMRPEEFRIWPHDYNVFYETFNRIFDCRGHGWSNLQSMHINLPFAGDDEFARLHAAIRVLLPLLPALAASSPIVEGRLTGLMDTRLDVYRNNAAKIPSISGLVIPEPVFSRAAYEQNIFQRMYADIAAHDPEGVLQQEWLNARGAIARFDRGAIEIRVLDVQECPQADLAIAALIVATLRALVEERWSTTDEQQRWPAEPLSRLLLDVCRDGERTMIGDEHYLALYGLRPVNTTAQEVWQYLLAELNIDTSWRESLDVIVNKGPLARRITNRLEGDASREHIAAVYRELCDCLAAGRLLNPR